jgi:hypothetical protein
MIEQVTVLLENEKGRLAALCRTLGAAGISMQALAIAETESYGLVRIVTDQPSQAAEALGEAGFRVSLNEVLAVQVPDVAGGLATLLDAIDRSGANIEFAYCFSSAESKAIVILGMNDYQAALQAVEGIGYQVIEPAGL